MNLNDSDEDVKPPSKEESSYYDQIAQFLVDT